jgi:hypothetical protein
MGFSKCEQRALTHIVNRLAWVMCKNKIWSMASSSTFHRDRPFINQQPEVPVIGIVPLLTLASNFSAPAARGFYLAQ